MVKAQPHLRQHVQHAGVTLEARSLIVAQTGQHHSAAHGVCAQQYRRLRPVARDAYIVRAGFGGGGKCEHALIAFRERDAKTLHQLKRHIQIGAAHNGPGDG